MKLSKVVLWTDSQRSLQMPEAVETILKWLRNDFELTQAPQNPPLAEQFGAEGLDELNKAALQASPACQKSMLLNLGSCCNVEGIVISSSCPTT